MELKNLYFQMLKNGIEELRAEKYQQERNGQAEALQITLDNLIELVNKTNDIHSVSGTYSKEDMEKSFDKGGDWRIACKNLTDGKISKIEWAENYEDFEEFISNYR